GIHAVIAGVGGITVLTGIWLYWRVSGGFGPPPRAAMGGRGVGAGGAAGGLALVLRGAGVGGRAAEVTRLRAKVQGTTDAAQRTTLMNEITATKTRLNMWGKIVLALQVVALVCMAVGHYV